MNVSAKVIQMLDLQAQYRKYQGELDDAVQRTLASGIFIMGDEVSQLEEELGRYCGVREAVCCSSGTDAIILALKALGVGAGDEVIVPDFTFAATAEAVVWAGARPVFADVRADNFTISRDSVESVITERTRCVIAVSLFGQCADMEALAALCSKHGLYLLEDAAQSFGASLGHGKSCNLSDIATTSFYPSKPLGAYGDGGAVFTNDSRTACRVRCLLDHGRIGRQHLYVGMNGRLDALQAAVLRVKLRHLDEELASRRSLAASYTRWLPEGIGLPPDETGASSWAQYTVRIPGRAAVIDHLARRGVPTMVYYPIPLHRQSAFADCRVAEVPVSTALSDEVLSLPLHPFLDEDDIRFVCDVMEEAR